MTKFFSLFFMEEWILVGWTMELLILFVTNRDVCSGVIRNPRVIVVFWE